MTVRDHARLSTRMRRLAVWIAAIGLPVAGAIWTINVLNSRATSTMQKKAIACASGISSSGIFTKNSITCNTINVYSKISHQIAELKTEPGTKPVEVSADNISFTINGCIRKESDTVSCPFVVVNRGPDRTITIGGYLGKSFIIDANGIQQNAQSAAIGNTEGWPVKAFAASGVAMKGAFYFGGHGLKISAVKRLFMQLGVRELNGGAPQFVLKWNTVPVIPS